MGKSKNRPAEKLTPPKEGAGDHLHTLTRAGLSMIPGVGGPAVELFQTVIAPPIRKRQQLWMEAVAAGLWRLEEKQRCIVEELQNNDSFIDTVMHASQAALRTADEEKRKALRNAVLNAALPNPPDAAKEQVFVNWVDQFTVWHLRILNLFASPDQWFAKHGKQPPQWSIAGSLSQLLIAAFPELANQRPLYDMIGRDLYQRGLLNTEGFHTTMSGHGAMAKRTTDLGDEFLGFIAAPEDALGR
ncbi:MAG: hypothetical protein HY000_41725 [Planctomycetes bacterium]|nr:hypothetical protein [Planctomycetota bacterium]